MKQVSFFHQVVRGCTMLFICTLSFLGSANALAQTYTENDYNTSDWSLDDRGLSEENPWVSFDENGENAIGIDVSSLAMRHKHSKHKKNKLTFKSTVVISQAPTNPPFDITITPFVLLPDGKIILGEPVNRVTIYGVVHFNSIKTPAIFGNYNVGIKVSSTSTDLSILTFFLDTFITSPGGESTFIGGLSYNLSSYAVPIGTAISEGQFINNFVFFKEKK